MMAEETEKFMADIASCKNLTGASDADVEDLYNRKLPANRAAKCFNKCMFTKLEIVSYRAGSVLSNSCSIYKFSFLQFKDGKLSQDGLVKIVEMDKSDLRGKDGRSLSESMKDILDECSKIVDADT